MNDVTSCAQFGDLVLQVSRAEGMIRIDFKGRSNERDPESQLGPLLREAGEAAERSGASLDLHFESLEFFNSSTITSLLRYLIAMHAKQVRVRIVYDASRRWQRVFFDSLASLDQGNGLLVVDPSGRTS